LTTALKKVVDTTTSESRQAASNLEKRCSLPLLVSTNLKVLAPLDRVLGVVLAALALQLQHNLLGGLGLLVEDGLGLTTIS